MPPTIITEDPPFRTLERCKLVSLALIEDVTERQGPSRSRCELNGEPIWITVSTAN
jgi:hypothetical protein